ncbi:hypothetical protein FA15DRAFT_669815 [Coprinopsis marcescibilis]|uniref:Uncharacterized protein n=1 Tax=Coprinopsis marcescibilis TaxID=230819 RepID=A0A5C3KUI1_COPMA|nr:hypothetical protein FA15DRAFT_669815 [Coprinopsis marcescibilis]
MSHSQPEISLVTAVLRSVYVLPVMNPLNFLFLPGPISIRITPLASVKSSLRRRQTCNQRADYINPILFLISRSSRIWQGSTGPSETTDCPTKTIHPATTRTLFNCQNQTYDAGCASGRRKCQIRTTLGKQEGYVTEKSPESQHSAFPNFLRT